MITNGWDVAHLFMHSSLDELAAAHNIYVAAGKVDVDSIDEQECFFLSPKMEFQDTNVKKHLVKAVALFQAGMEAVFHWMQNIDPEIKSNKGFANNWEEAFKKKGINFNFSKYRTFYEEYRIHIMHPDKEERFETINNLEFHEVFEGIKAGWLAYKALSEAVGYKHDDGSWKIMCNAHDLPTDLGTLSLINPKEVARLLNLRHGKYLRRMDENT